MVSPGNRAARVDGIGVRGCKIDSVANMRRSARPIRFCKRPIDSQHDFGNGCAARPGFPCFRGEVVKRHGPSPRIGFVAFEHKVILATIFH